MVKLSTSALLSLCYVATLGLCAPSPNTVTHVQRSVAQLEIDLGDMTDQLKTLSTTIDNVDPKVASATAATAVHAEGLSLCKSLGRATTDTKLNGDLDEKDSEALLALLQGFPAAANHTLSTLAAKKSAFQVNAIPHLFTDIKQDLQNFQGNMTEFSDEISKSSAPDLASNFKSLCDSVIVSIHICIVAFSQ